MPQTRAALRQKLSRDYLFDYVSGTATGAGSTTTLVDTARAGKVNDYYKNWWVIVTSGDRSGDIREVDVSYTDSSGTFTWTPVLAGAPGTATYELSRIDPAIKHAALNRAARTVSKYSHMPIVDTSIVTGSRIMNGGFVHWSTGVNGGLPLGWKKSNSSLTVSRRAGTPSGSAVRLTSGAYQLQTLADFDPDTSGYTDGTTAGTINIYGVALTSTASHARIGASVNGTASYSGYATSDGLPTPLEKLDLSVPALLYQLMFVLDIAGNATAEFADIYTKGGPQMYSYPVPSSFHEVTAIDIDLSGSLSRQGQSGIWQPVTGWTFRRQAGVFDQDVTAPAATIGRIHDLALPHGFRMRWTGYGAIQTASSDSTYMEVEPQWEQYFLTLAAQYVYEALAADSAGETQKSHIANAERWRLKVRELEARHESVLPPQSAHYPVALG